MSENNYNNKQLLTVYVLVLYYLFLCTVQQGDPAAMAFKQHLVTLMSVLHPHVEDIASSACLIPADIDRDVMYSPEVPSDKKVIEVLNAVQRSITGDSEALLRFVEVLRKEETFLKLMGDRLENTYRENTYVSL